MTDNQKPAPPPPVPPNAQRPIDGLGDAIRRVTERLGVPHCQKCDERQKTLNRWVPNPFRRGR